MATFTLTSNLKLKISSDLTPDAKQNLLKIDNLASLYQINSNEQALIRSKTDIILQPQSQAIGGSGSGGNISIGTTDQPAATVTIAGSSINLTGAVSLSGGLGSSTGFSLINGSYSVLLAPPSTLSENITLRFPNSPGSANQVLETDGAGNLSWATLSGTDIGQELAANWVPLDGPIKTITHNFGTQKILVQILDSGNNYATIDIDNVERMDLNNIVLTASSTPINTWIVLLKQII